MKEYFKRLFKKSVKDFNIILKNNLQKNKKSFIVTANPETFMFGEKDSEINKLLLDENTIIVPDGISIVKASKMLGYDTKERISGIDIAWKLLEYGNDLKKSIYLFGSEQSVIDDLKKVIKKSYPNLKVVGTKNGYIKDKDKVFDEILKKEPDIVLVALGIPNQEKLIYKHLSKFKKGIFVGVGGSFDVMSGHKKRAPKLFIKLNLEWLYRIICEPKRIKRFYNSNVKFMFKIRKLNEERIKTSDLLLIISILLIMFLGTAYSVFFQKDINAYENRMAYKYRKPTINRIINKDFQNNLENTLSDQIPLSSIMKKAYNFGTNYVSKSVINLLTNKYCLNNYINVNQSLVTFGCDNNIVYSPIYTYYSKENFDNRINDINSTILKAGIPVYVYYIEKDTDIDFNNNEKTEVSDYIFKNINSTYLKKYEINNFEDFKENFYKTDHHWNNKGSYLAYTQLADFLQLKNPIIHNNEKCSKTKFTGSKANVSGAALLYNEKFCTYDFPIPEHKTYINGDSVNDYGVSDIESLSVVSYGNYYGGDDGEIIFDYNNPSKNNILVIGESYDNAILKLLSTHFNKLFSIDLRHYERENGKKFNYKEYIKLNKIDQILLIGNIDFFRMNEFNLEG